MLEKIVYNISNLIKKGGEKPVKMVTEVIKTDLVRSPQAGDSLVFKAKNQISKQLMSELEKVLEFFDGKDEILKNANEDNIDVIMKMAKIKDSYDELAYRGVLKELAPKITSKNKDVLLKLSEIESYNGNLAYKNDLKNLAPIITDENKDEIIKMAELKDSRGIHVHYGYGVLKDSLERLEEIKYKTNSITDLKILDCIKENNALIANKETLKKADEVLDSVYTRFS